MAVEPSTPDAITERLDDLYWNTSSTVEEILDTLGVSRNTLYSSIRPLPADVSCATCGDMLVFTNRTNRASGAAACTVCGREVIVREDAFRDREAEGSGRPAGVGGDGESERWTRLREDLVSVAPERAAWIGGAAALGVVFGAAAVRAFRALD